MIKYRATNWGAFTIEKVDVYDETANYYKVVDMRDKHSKIGKHHCYYDTWEECKDHFIVDVNVEIKRVRAELQRALDKYVEIKDYKFKED